MNHNLIHYYHSLKIGIFLRKLIVFLLLQIRPQYELYRRDTETSLGEPLNTFWAECYEAGKAAAGARARAQQDSRARFQVIIFY